MACKITSIAASVLSSLGANPPSSPTAVERPFFFNTALRALKVSVIARRPSEKLLKPLGMIMNSWKSIGASECAPPLMTLAIGTGRTFAFGPPRYRSEEHTSELQSPPDPHSFPTRRSSDLDHDLLEINRCVRVCPAIDDVGHRHRQDLRVRPTQI